MSERSELGLQSSEQDRVESVIGNAKIVKEVITLSEGLKTSLITIYTKSSTRFDLVWDPLFDELGIRTEPRSNLISPSLTKDLWRREVGMFPEEYLTSHDSDTAISVCPSNANLQLGAFLIKNGSIFSADKNLQGRFNVIGITENHQWNIREINMNNNVATAGNINDLKMGFSMPLIVNEGEVVPIENIIGDPRLTADPRNIFDYAHGKTLPPEFWVYLRRLLPSTVNSGRRFLRGGQVVIRTVGALTEEEYSAFQTIINENRLGKFLQLDKKEASPRLLYCGKFPLQRLPVIGVGILKDKQLIVCAADGRQKESAGLTIEELGQIMVQRGAIYVGLGAAGGDVSIVKKVHRNQPTVINSPSNQDEKGNQVTRREPSQLIIY